MRNLLLLLVILGAYSESAHAVLCRYVTTPDYYYERRNVTFYRLYRMTFNPRNYLDSLQSVPNGAQIACPRSFATPDDGSGFRYLYTPLNPNGCRRQDGINANGTSRLGLLVDHYKIESQQLVCVERDPIDP